MRDVAPDPAATDPAALERLRAQRGRLADRLRPPWWYLPGIGIVYALAFTAPFGKRFFPQGVRTWPILFAVVAVACLLQWGLNRVTGVAVNTRMLRYPSGRPAAIAIVVVGVATIATETFLIDRGLIAVAIVVAALGVVAEVACQRAHLRGIRQDLRAG